MSHVEVLVKTAVTTADLKYEEHSLSALSAATLVSQPRHSAPHRPDLAKRDGSAPTAALLCVMSMRDDMKALEATR
ncbi:hypothetical protein [Paracoccus sp. (in: a-proteobacteria)]|uniref:hypothetical protein n=1 Tax=Paracoccus sp. TaxID=267 RepID=UPI00396C63C7